jgi:lysophospholipase L1-like esterase
MTIPALLAKELADKGISVEITNFGESGYVSTQEVISLLVELRKHTPDLVIFYDGVNDTFSSYQQGTAGLPQNEFHRVSEFGLLSHGNRAKLREAAFRGTLQDLHLVRFSESILRRIGFTRQQDGLTALRPMNDGHRDALASGVVATYQSNVRLVSAMAEQYGFRALFYWQPTIFQKRNLTAYEQEVRRYADPMGHFFQTTYELVHKGKAGSGVRDLSLVFSDIHEALYVDWCHLGEHGNGMIAREMAGDVLPALRAVHADKVSRSVADKTLR